MKKTMQKFIVLILAATLVVTVLAACSGQSNSGDDVPSDGGGAAAVDVSSLETLGDALTLEAVTTAASWDDSVYCYAAIVDGTPIRVAASMTPELVEQMDGLDFFAEDYSQQLLDLIGGQPLISAEEFSADVPSQDELDSYVGKTGQDVLDGGFVFKYYSAYGADTQAMALMESGNYSYYVTFEESIDDADDSDGGEAIKGLTVASIEICGFADGFVDPTQFE